MLTPAGRRGLLLAAFSCGLAVCTVNLISRKLARLYKRRQLSKKRLKKQADLREAKEAFEKFLKANPGDAELEAEILSCTTPQLIKKLREGLLDAKDVLLAFQRKAFQVDKKLNCIVEFFEADPADSDLSGPLAGLPVSIKDNFSFKGHDSCVGCSIFIGDPAKEDCSPVKLVRKLGGVPFCKTVVPQSMLSTYSHNPIDGVVANPVRTDRSPGGSSSGEAALVAAGGSPLGLGTDIGGSIRLPAAFCGIQGFKPTSGRLTYLGFRNAAAQKLIPPSWGPLAADVETLILFMTHFCSGDLQYELDPAVPRLGWDLSQLGALDASGDLSVVPKSAKPLRIGFYCYDGVFKAVPAAERVVIETKAALESLGHELVPWTPPVLDKEKSPMYYYLQGIFCDGGEQLLSILEHDELSPALKDAHGLLTKPVIVRKFLLRALTLFGIGDPDLKLSLSCTLGTPTVRKMWQFALELAERRRHLMEDWRSRGLDAVICPAVGTPAVPLSCHGGTTGAISYPSLYNTLNFPAGSVSVGQVTRADLEAMADYPRGRSAWHKKVADVQEGSLGLPVSVQCVALPWRDELCLRVMLDVQNSFRH